MEKMRIIDFRFGSTSFFEGPIPIVCPHCGSFITADLLNCVSIRNNQYPFYYASMASGRCCNKLFLMTHSVDKEKKGTLLYVWPAYNGIQLPDCIAEISPRFCDLFQQSA